MEKNDNLHEELEAGRISPQGLEERRRKEDESDTLNEEEHENDGDKNKEGEEWVGRPVERDEGVRSVLQRREGEEVLWVEFVPGSKRNPFNWTSRKKWTITILCCWYCLLVASTASAFAICIPGMTTDLGSKSEINNLALGLQVAFPYPLGFGVAPLVLAPFSEAYGRNPLYIVTTLLYAAFFIPQALTRSIAAICVVRFLSGAAASTGSTMVGGTVADMFESSQRGVPMSIFSICTFAGTGLGAVWFGYVEQDIGWRWSNWIQLILASVTWLLMLLILRETRGSVILSRIAQHLRSITGDERYKVKADEERASLAILIRVSLSRPLYLMATEPVVLSFSLWVGFAWGVLYLLLEAIPLVCKNVYGFDNGQTGLAFFAITIGGVFGGLSNPWQ
ncbi:MFS general substrate transporter, partial [Atractiella rhizophila]